MGYQSLEEGDLNKKPSTPDFDKVLITITDQVLTGFGIVKRNEDNPKLIDGCAMGEIKSSWWSSDEFLYINIFYIKEDKRTFKLAAEFMNKIKECAIINQIPVILDVFTQKDAEKKRKMFRYFGFKEVGSFLIFDPAHP